MQLVGRWWVVTMVSNSSSVELFGGLTKTCSCHFIVHDNSWLRAVLMAKNAEGKCSIVFIGWFLKVSGELGGTKQMTPFGWSIDSSSRISSGIHWNSTPQPQKHQCGKGPLKDWQSHGAKWAEAVETVTPNGGFTGSRVQRRVGVRTRPGLGGENCI